MIACLLYGILISITVALHVNINNLHVICTIKLETLASGNFDEFGKSK